MANNASAIVEIRALIDERVRAVRAKDIDALVSHHAPDVYAVQRRALPPGGKVPEDYVFEAAGAGGKPKRVKLSELFAPGKDTLAAYSFMFGPERESGHARAARTSSIASMAQRINLAVVACSFRHDRRIICSATEPAVRAHVHRVEDLGFMPCLTSVKPIMPAAWLSLRAAIHVAPPAHPSMRARLSLKPKFGALSLAARS